MAYYQKTQTHTAVDECRVQFLMDCADFHSITLSSSWGMNTINVQLLVFQIWWRSEVAQFCIQFRSLQIAFTENRATWVWVWRWVMKSIKLGLLKNLAFFQIYRVVFFTWHLPLTHMSTDPGLHGVPSITLEASLAEKRYRGFFGLQNNEHGWPVTKK